MNALVPGSGMADMFVRNAGTGIARGLVNSPSGPQRVGGRGAPEGAMPTRKFGSTRESVGELKSGFKDWLADPLQAKKEKREQARDTALAVRLGITGGEYSLTHRPAMSLIKKRTGDVQTNIMILQFRVQQFMARNLSAIASTLGVQKSKIGHEEPDPNRSWFGSLLSSIHKDLQENKAFSFIESLGKHAINIGRILNPLTLASRTGTAFKNFGEFMQKLALGKEGFEFMKDPNKLYEKAGLKQDFQTKAVNLMKINNEYQKHQLNMLYNIVGIGEKLLGVFGVQHNREELDITHDEYEGTLKTKKEAARARRQRESMLEVVQKRAARHGIFGKIAPLTAGLTNIYQSFQSMTMPYTANGRDRYVLANIYDNFDLETLRNLTPDLARFIDALEPDVDFTKDKVRAGQFKMLLLEAMKADFSGDSYRRKGQNDLKKAWRQSGKIASQNTILTHSQNAGTVAANIFTRVTGNASPRMWADEHIHKQRAFERRGYDAQQVRIGAGASQETTLTEGFQDSIFRKILRALGGPIAGIGQQLELGGISADIDEVLRRAPEKDKTGGIMGYGKISGASRGRNGIFDNLFSNTILTMIDDAAIKKLTAETYNVKLVGFGNNIIQDPSTLQLIKLFLNRIKSTLQPLIDTNLKDVLTGKDGFIAKLFKQFRDWNDDTDPKTSVGIRYDDPQQIKALTTPAEDILNAVNGLRSDVQSLTTTAHGNAFSGGNISDYSNQIVSQPTLFRYDELHKFAKGDGLMGEAGAEGVFPLKRDKNGDLGIGAPSVIHALLVDIEGNPLPISLPPNKQKIEEKKEEINKNSEDDNVKTAAERQKDIEERQEKKEEEKKEQKQEANEEEKKTILQRIADYINPESKFNKLREFVKKKKESGGFSLSALWENAPDLLKKLGIGALAGFIYSQFSEQINKFLIDTVGSTFNSIVKYFEENGSSILGGIWEHFQEHPIFDSALFTLLFPGVVGTVISKIGLPLITKAPLSLPLVIGMGGMVYSLVDAFSHSKDETGGFSIGKFLNEFFLGSSGGIVGTLGKAASWGWMGAKIGAMFGGVGAVPGMLVGAALGALVGSTDSRDEQGNFSWGKFFKNLAVGNDAAGGLANGGKQFLKWGLVGGAIGGPMGFLLAGSIGGLLGIVGADGFSKIYKMGEESGQTVAKFFKWEKGSFAYKAATCGAANSIPWVGAFIFGALGSILDLGSMLIKGLWGWVKSFLPQSVIDRIEGNQTEYEKEYNEKNKNKVSVKFKEYDGMTDTWNDQELNMNVNDKDAEYINSAKDDNEKLKRYREIETKRNRHLHWGNEAKSGINGKKYDPEKYIALKEKWAEEDRKRDEIEAYEIDVPLFASGIKDFPTTQENAKQYQDLYDKNKDDAVEFARGVYAKQQEEKNKREAERASALKKIEVGSSPEELQMDAQRKASSAPAAMAAVSMEQTPRDVPSPNERKKEFQQKLSSALSAMYPNVDSEAGEDNQGTGFDIKDTKTKIAEDKTKSKELKFDYAKLNQIYLNTEAASNEGTPKSTHLPNNEPKKSLKFDFAKYNQQALAIPAGAEFGTTQITKENYNPPQATMLQQPTSTPAAEKAKQDASQSQQQTTQPVVQQGDPTAGTPQDTSSNQGTTSPPSGGLNWIEKIISNTIQGAFKVGGFIADVAQKGAGAAQNMMNGGFGSSGVEGSGAPFIGGNKAPGIGGRYGAIAGKRDELVLPLNQRAKGPNGKPMEWSQATNNPGNVGNTDQGGTFIFPDLQSGIKAQRDLLKERYSGMTLRNMAMKYTPTKWREALPTWSSKSGIGTEEIPNMNDTEVMARLLKAIQFAEGSSKWVPSEEVDYALGLKPLPDGYKPKDYRQLTEKGKAYVSGGGAMWAGGSTAFGTGGSTNVPSKVFPGAPRISQQLLQSWQISPSEKLVWPAQSGVITSPMGPRKGGTTSAGGSVSSWHRGIDIRARQGNPIYAAMGGKVTGTSSNFGQVKIDHGNGWTSRYLHMSGFNVKPGQTVNAGDVIGAAGGIGKGGRHVYTPHLHFEMHKNGQFVDPEGVYYMYGKGGGHTTYDQHSYNGIAASRQIQAKIGVGGDEDDRGGQLNKSMSKFLSTPNTSSNTAPMKLSDKIGVGGDENYRGDQIRSSMNDYLSETGGDESTKSNIGSGIISELKRVQVLLAALIKTSGKPTIAVAAPSSSGNEDPQKKVTEAGGMDSMADSVFSQIGGLLPNLNISLTGLGTSIS